LLTVFSPEHFMKEAYKEALIAYKENEIPVGAVVVCNNKIIARGHNQTEALNDVTAHAEMIALTSASNHLGSKYLNECDLYVTLEPCVMCAGAIFWAQLRSLIYGTSDIKRGFMTVGQKILHPKTEITKGIMEKESEKLLLDFFNKLR
jgi:tRNA(adenine34) deaminase